MRGIPERGYGSFRQWRRRVLKKGVNAHFYVNGGTGGATVRWQKYHMEFLPTDCRIAEPSTVRECTEAQV